MKSIRGSFAFLAQGGLAVLVCVLPTGAWASAGAVFVSTTPNPSSVTLGTSPVTLRDSANLTGGSNPTGTLTFTLRNPGLVTVDTETVSVNGDGTYNTPTGFTLPTNGTVTGTYSWAATFQDNFGGSASETGELVTVNPASPTLLTTAGGTVILGSGARLTDSANLSGGYFDTGTITFTLFTSSNVAVYTDVVTVSGNGTYTTAQGSNPGGYLPTLADDYLWKAVYSGDGNNNGASDNGINETQLVTGGTAPEPATLALLGLGLAGLGFSRRKRTQ